MVGQQRVVISACSFSVSSHASTTSIESTTCVASRALECYGAPESRSNVDNSTRVQDAEELKPTL